MKITVDVNDYEVKRVRDDIRAVSKTKLTLKKAAELFAQDLIDRYFSTEYLDAEHLGE